MRKIIVTTFVSMDGVMQAPGGPQEDPTNDFKWGGWTAEFWDEVMNQVMQRSMDNPYDLLLGRKTYEIFAAHWPYAEDPISMVFNKITKYVVSAKGLKPDWQNSVLITGDAVKEIRSLRDQNGPDLLVNGSGKLVQTLLANGLVDRLYLWIFPSTIGKGKRLFEEGTIPANWKLMETTVSRTGVIIAVYEPAGEIRLGSFALDPPTEAEVRRRQKLKEEDQNS